MIELFVGAIVVALLLTYVVVFFLGVDWMATRRNRRDLTDAERIREEIGLNENKKVFLRRCARGVDICLCEICVKNGIPPHP